MADFKMLAIDLGASSGRGIIGRFDGEKLSLEENHRFPNEPVTAAGTFTWDILRIFHEIKESIRKCALSDDKDIRSIGIDTWGVDYGLLDINGKLIANPVHYRDSRNDPIPEIAYKTVPQNEIYNRTGIQFLTFNTLFQLIAQQRENPKVLELADKLLFIPDLLNYFLTGQKCTDYTIASTGAMLDARTRQWDFELMKKFGIPEKLFTSINAPGTTVGKLLPEILDDVGNITANVVNTAGHDTASAVVAVPAKGDNFVYISSGTWSLMGTELSEPIITPDSFKYDFTNEGGAGNKIRFLKNIMGLWLEQESIRQWTREGSKLSFDELTSMAIASKPFACLINPDDPSFTAPGNMPKRIADYCKATGQHVPETKGEIVRCIFESLALKYRWTVEKIDMMMGKKAPFINIVGGGIKEKLLCQFAADACNRPVYAGPVEATAIGNIAVQAIAAGEIKDLNEARHVVRNSFEIKLYEPQNTAMWDDGYDKFKKLLGE